MTLRDSLDALRAGPALMAGLPGDEVDVERLIAHLVAHGFSGGVHLIDQDTESVLLVYEGAPRDVWFFESGGSEVALAGMLGHDLFHQMAARGGTLSVLIGDPPRPLAVEAAADVVAPVDAPAASVAVVVPAAPPVPQAPPPDPPAPEPVVVAPPEPARVAPVVVAPSTEPAKAAPPPEAVAVVSASAAPPAEAGPTGAPKVEPSIPEPPSHPWAAILQDVAERVARHRGAKLAARFTTALEAALAAQGGRLEGGRIIAPGLSESTWRIVVEAACAPITAVAGRAFVDRTIAAAEREVRAVQAGGSGLR
jgi:hypothetical protein